MSKLNKLDMKRYTSAENASPYWNPYVAGALLGLVLLASFVFAGRGIGGSGAYTRFSLFISNAVYSIFSSEPLHELKIAGKENEYLKNYLNTDSFVLDHFLVYMFLGVLLGGFTSGFFSKRLKIEIIKGPQTTNRRRIFLAVLGGIFYAIGTRIGRGCTAGQILCGTSTLSVGSWIFMAMVFMTVYALAYFFRKEWL